MNIPTPLNSPVYAVADGRVRIPGSHPDYSDGVVQVKQIISIQYIELPNNGQIGSRPFVLYI